ncbi:uncharacterized protein LOC144134849 [Amblyomma americanum]
MLSLRFSVLLPLLVAPSGGARWAWGPRAELSQFLQNMSWQHDPHISEELRKSVLGILGRQPSPGLLHRRRVPFRPIGELPVFGSLAGRVSRSPRSRTDHHSGLPVGGSILTAKNRPQNMKFERGKPNIYDVHMGKSVQLFCSVAYQSQVSIFWTLNGKPLEDYDSLSEETVPEGRVSSVLIKSVTRLPTMTGVYTFNCTTLTDYDLATVHLDVNMPLSDACQDTSTECADRMAVCKNSACVCEGYYKVRLLSKHVTCRSEAYLETPCMYDEQCLNTTEHSECTGHGWCACLKGYGRTEEHKCVPKVGARSRCNSEEECADYDATCILNHCTCFSHKKELNDRCVNLAEHLEANKLPYGRGVRRSPVKLLVVLVALLRFA